MPCISGKNSVCAVCVCGYVGSMNWQQFLILATVLAVVVVSVWRGSGKKSGCGRGCAHDHGAEAKKEKSAAH